jgi:hypothetical protein
LDRLRVHLRPLERTFQIEVWDDSRIKPGSKWKEEIATAIKAARVAVLLVSADFLASDFVATDELPPLLRAAEKEGAVIMPLIIGHSRFSRTPSLSQFQTVNDPAAPLASMTSNRREKTLVIVADQIESFLASVPSAPPQEKTASLSPKQVERLRAGDKAPQLLARFSTDRRGRLLRKDEHYEIRLFIKDPPPTTRSVVYTLDKSYSKPTRKVNKGVPDFEEYITSYGDYEVGVKINAGRPIQFKTYLSSALEHYYGNKASGAVREAIDHIVEN